MEEVKTFFDVVNNICSSKTLLQPEQVVGLASPYMMNRAMSFNHDTAFFAEEASAFRNIDPYQLYMFYFYSTPKKKRYGKWTKKVNNEDLQLVQSSYGVSEKKAMEYLDILKPEQLEALRQASSQGGKTGRASKKK